MTPVLRRHPDAPEPNTWWTRADGMRLAADVRGPLTGPAVIFLHGLGQTRHAWRRTAQSLADRGFCTVAFDARGHGDSDWSPSGDYSRDAMRYDLHRVVQAVQDPAPTLVGASMGGISALLAVGEGVCPARALVLVDIAHRSQEEGLSRVRGFMRRHADGFDSLEAVARAVGRYQGGQVSSDRLQGLAKNVRCDDKGRYHWHWDPRVLDRAPDPPERRPQAARSLQVPTLLIRGGRSDVLDPETVREFQQLCPQAQCLEVPDARHMLGGDANDAFGQVLIQALQHLLSPVNRAP